MIRRGRVAGAALGLLLLAAPIGAGPLRAQTGDEFTPPAECSDPPPPPMEKGISVTVVSPTGTEPRTSPNVPVEASFTNESRRPVVNQPNGQISELRAAVLACEPGRTVPTAPDPVQPAGDPRTASIAWSAEFTTNGRFVIVLEADGTSTNPEGTQAARVVVPVTLSVPPKKPTNVDVSDPSNGVVTISWDYVEPEPDLFGFEIRRAAQGSSRYVPIENGAVGPEIRAVTDTPPVGAWRYQVIAYRQGAPEGSVSRDGTVEVAEAAPASESDGGTTTASSTPGGTGSATGTGGGGSGSSTTLGGTAVGPGGAPRSTVDLSNFAATLNARRTAPATRVEPPDPGFQETLPFDTSADLEVEEPAEEPEELGANEPNVGLGQRPVSDPGERQRSLGFVAFGLLLFVLSMTGLFVKSEVKRADLLELDAVDADATGTDVTDDGPVVASPAVAAAAAIRSSRRRRPPATPPSPDEATAPAPVPAGAAAVTHPRRRRRPPATSHMAAAPDSSPASAAAASAAPAGSAPEPRRRRAARPTTGSVFEIPEARRRWSGRVAEPANGHATTTSVHDFDDLAADPTAVAATTTATSRAPVRQTEAPLDAPGLDVPDPPPPAAQRRSVRTTASALPARKKPTAARR